MRNKQQTTINQYVVYNKDQSTKSLWQEHKYGIAENVNNETYLATPPIFK